MVVIGRRSSRHLIGAALQLAHDAVVDPVFVPPFPKIDLYVDLHAEVYVHAASEPGLAGGPHLLSLFYHLALLYVDLAQMAVDRLQAIAVVQYDAVPVDAEIFSPHHAAVVGWQLHRRISSENSAIIPKFDDLFPNRDPVAKAFLPDPSASPLLFRVFLDKDQSHNKDSGQPLTSSFAADLCVRATEYEVDGLLVFKNHYEGGYLFRDMLTLEATPPDTPNGDWKIRYRLENQRGHGWQDAQVHDGTNILTFEIPIEQPIPPGIKARLHVETHFWNDWQS